MGDPKKLKKKYSTPVHPWNKTEIDKNKILRKEYGLKNRRELLIFDSFLKKYKDIAKKLIADETVQGLREKKQMMDKLQKLGLISHGAELDGVLSLEVKDVLERRLQSVVFRKGLARTIGQSRQFITHRHIVVGDKEITAPSYIISVEEENKLGFKCKSSLFNEDHPERSNPAEEIKKEAEAVKPKKEDKDKKEEKTEDKDASTKEVKETKDKKEKKVEETPTTEEPVESKEEKKTAESKEEKEEVAKE